MMTDINSRQYWDSRFDEDWEQKNGPSQSRFFAKLAVQHLPDWFFREIKRKSLSVVDWGCAQGDGTDFLASYVDSAKLYGVDFSKVAIDQATERYPALSFHCENWLENGESSVRNYDIVFSSNTLEHFHQPYQVLERLASRADKAVVLAIPYRELDRYQEHFFSFLAENIPLEINNKFRLVWSTVVDCSRIPSTYWVGEQIFLLYAESSWLAELRPTLSDCRIEQSDYDSEIERAKDESAKLNSRVIELEEAVKHADQLCAERDAMAGQLKEQAIQSCVRLEETSKNVDQLRSECEALAEQVSAQAAQFRAQLEEASKHTDQIRSERDALALQLDAVAGQLQEQAIQHGIERQENSKQVHQILSERDAVAGQLREEAVRSRDSDTLAGQLRRELQKTSMHVDRLRSEKEALAHRVRDVALAYERSTSWKVTRPVRALRNGYRVVTGSRHSNGQRAAFLVGMLRKEGPTALGRWLWNRLDVSFVPVLSPGSATVGDDLFHPPAALPVVSSRPTNNGHPGLVSIILPIYNQSNFLAEAIEGIIRQTYKNWELIIVNDGSTDEFASSVAPYLSDPRVRVYEQPNQKLPSALNNAFKVARGEFFTWTSADNVMLDGQIETLVGALRSHPEVGFVYSDYEAIDDRGAPLADPNWRSHNRSNGCSRLHLPQSANLSNLHDSGDNFIGASFLWRSDVHHVVGCHDENTFGGEDYDFWLRMHLITPFLHVAKPLYRYRVHDNTLNAKAKELRLVDNVKRLLVADQTRRRLLLEDPDQLLPSSGQSYWRDVAQYKAQELGIAFTRIRYSEIETNEPPIKARDHVRVVEIDVPLREINLNLLAASDILLSNDQLVLHWLARCELPTVTRLLYFPGGPAAEEMLLHAVAHCAFEQRKAQEGYRLAQQPRAEVSQMREPRHIMLAIGKWRYGGMEQVMLDLATSFHAAGMTVTLAVCDEEPNSELKTIAANAGLPVVGFAGSADKLVQYVQDFAIDLVNYHHCYLGAKELSQRKIRTLYTLHNSYIWFTKTQLNAWGAALQSISGYVAVSRQVAEYARKWLSLSPERLYVVPNGTSLDSTQATNALEHDEPLSSFPRGGTKFLNVATFNRIKCQDRLVRSFAPIAEKFADAHLTLVGTPVDKHYFDHVIDLRARLGLDQRCTVIPGMSRESVLGLMKDHDCLVLPSLIEGWSISLAEAALSALPAIVSDVGSARDLAAISNAVQLVPGLAPRPEDLTNDDLTILYKSNATFEQNISTAMERFIDNRQAYQKEAQLALDRFGTLFSPERVLKQYREIFASL